MKYSSKKLPLQRPIRKIRKKPKNQVHEIDISHLPTYIQKGLRKYEEEKLTNIIIKMGYPQKVRLFLIIFRILNLLVIKGLKMRYASKPLIKHRKC